MGSLIIAGDVALADHQVDISSLNNSLLSDENDTLIFNLEGPLAESTADLKPIKNDKFNLYTKISNIGIFKQKNLLVSLANNHINDFHGSLRQTIFNLNKLKINYFGTDKVKYQSIVVDEKQFIIFGYNSQLTLASSDKNIATIKNSNSKEIEDAKKNNPEATIIVLPHFGFELKDNPIPADRKWCRKMIDAGADFIIGSHPHIVQSYENYNDSHIFYSVGNFILPQKQFLDKKLIYNDPKVNSGYIIKIKSKSDFELHKIQMNETQDKIEYNGELPVKNIKSSVEDYLSYYKKNNSLPRYYPIFKTYDNFEFKIKYFYVKLTQAVRGSLMYLNLYNPYK